MKKVAYLTTSGLEGFFVYDALTYEPLAALGIAVEAVPWRQPGVDWSRYDAVVIRSTWDYQQHPDEFLHTLTRIDAGTKLLNPLEVVRWNLDKRYLLDLHARGVVIVPTRVAEDFVSEEISAAFDEFATAELIVKPTVSANADDTFRVRRDDTVALRAACDRLAHRAALVQPFVASIEDEGEVSLFYFDGECSHAIRKSPAPGDFRVQEEHGGRLEPLVPSAALAAAGRAALAALPADLLYARVDFVRMPDGAFALMEAELIEPSLYFQLDDAAAERFAGALERRLR
jgi:glutathione synthase/RimK-type ligase-like ATP-grasp enzyme